MGGVKGSAMCHIQKVMTEIIRLQNDQNNKLYVIDGRFLSN